MKKIIGFIMIFFLVFLVGCKDEEVLSSEQQLALDIQIIDDYLEANNIDAQVHESEIRYVVETEGTGESPTESSRVIAKYEGRFLDGQVFDKNSIGVNFGLDNLIQAWKEMIPEMKEGGKITIYCPSGLGYGRIGSGSQGIPGNAILVFDIELVSLVRSDSEQLAIDLAIIDEYLAENNIDAEVHSSGIRFVTITEGTGQSPTLSSLLNVDYTGKLLNGEVFDANDAAELRLNNLIDAWKTMLPTMQEGGKIVFYSPSKYCYGNTGFADIAPNTNLIFEVELNSIR
ncbi:FKBP-type peptidyl-prolyl cis-trans isomerase [Ekhidna sp.]|uniref:FKBP-type peptidyl-prolyl cis-trans isomerase n=1 Tax=Ekhidna sp. TaxID=2608089 RepID=UPI0032993609